MPILYSNALKSVNRLTNSVDLDQIAPEQFNLGLPCLPRPVCLKTRLSMIFLRKHYMNVSVLIKFSQKTSVFTLIIISYP